MTDVKITKRVRRTIDVLMAAPEETGMYGLALVAATDLPNGTLFPILDRLMRAGWVDRYWEDDETAEAAKGRSRRRYYRLTQTGRERADALLST